ncbi:hypothetical protein ELD19_29950, partial [Klebsiella pneumoniae]|nr:hypothetical protein [Klebsiella pneumoniae]
QQAEQQQGGQGDVLILRGIRNQQQQELRQCCQALQNMDQQCQCEGLRQQAEQQQGGQGDVLILRGIRNQQQQ